jgi:nucleoid-associated protein YgaU
VWSATATLVGIKDSGKDVSTAAIAAKNSAPLNTDPTQAPTGAYHFMTGLTTAGHTALQVQMGAASNPILLMASNINGGETLGKDIRLVDLAGYIKAGWGGKYLGWSVNYAGSVPGDWSHIADNPTQDWTPPTPPTPPTPTPPTPPAPTPPAPGSYTVKPGDTLWDIVATQGWILPGEDHYAACQRIAALNNIRTPELIYPGQIIHN